jgi:hypothetical protein
VLLMHILNNALLSMGGVIVIWVLRTATGSMP